MRAWILLALLVGFFGISEAQTGYIGTFPDSAIVIHDTTGQQRALVKLETLSRYLLKEDSLAISREIMENQDSVITRQVRYITQLKGQKTQADSIITRQDQSLTHHQELIGLKQQQIRTRNLVIAAETVILIVAIIF